MPPPPPLLALPPHASMPPNRASNTIKPSIERHLRRRVGMPKRKMHARVAPPEAIQGIPGLFGYASTALVAAVVEIVSVAVPAVVPVMLTGLVEPKLKVGGYWVPAGLEVRAAVSATLPVRPPTDVTVIVEVFPVVAPLETVRFAPVIVKPGAVVTVTGAEPVLPFKYTEAEASGV